MLEFLGRTGPRGNKRKVRRLLPDKNGEKFNTTLTNLLSGILRKSIFKIIQKSNR